MRIINLVRDVQPIRMGVWTSATSTARCLYDTYGVESELWYPGDSHGYSFDACESVQLEGAGLGELKRILGSRKFDKQQTVIVAHSPWGFQTKWMKYAGKMGLATMFVPHGTLEPWSMRQKALKKAVYFRAVEQRNILSTRVIRALSKPEFANLQKMFPTKDVRLIPNGVAHATPTEKPLEIKQVLFIGRLHHKKGLVELVNGWAKSEIARNPSFRLVIAGPDEGELAKIQPVLDQCRNAEYVGPQYGADKERVLCDSHYFILPSASEGFPVAVLEAAEYGLCPVISEGCNFPELLSNDMAIEIRQDTQDVTRVLDALVSTTEADRLAKVEKLRGLIREEYSIEAIARQQFEVYTEMLGQ